MELLKYWAGPVALVIMVFTTIVLINVVPYL